MPIAPTAISNAAIGEAPEVLSRIHDPAVNIAILERSLPHLQQEVGELLDREIKVKSSGNRESVLQDFEAHFSGLGLNCPGILGDIASLLEIYGGVATVDSFKVLLTTVNSNMCRRFHTDINDLRMICTYVGPGTLWLPDAVVDRDALGSNAENSGIVIEEDEIQHVGTGDVAILKGALYPNAKAIVHRSPAIEGDDTPRLLLRVDTNEFLAFLD